MAHKDIQIQFKIKDEATGKVRRYDAKGFLEEDEEFVAGFQAIARIARPDHGVFGGSVEEWLAGCDLVTGKAGANITAYIAGKEEESFLWEHRRQLPASLWNYELVVSCSLIGTAHYVSIFGLVAAFTWSRGSVSVGAPLLNHHLIVHRLP